MKNLARITNYYNLREAWKDWEKVAALAASAGMQELVDEYRPAETAGWRKVDASTARLAKVIGLKWEPGEN